MAIETFGTAKHVINVRCSILKTAGRSDIPVFSGASKAIVASVSEKKWEVRRLLHFIILQIF